MMQAKPTYYVFPPELAERVLRFSKVPERQQACAALQAMTGRDPIGWGTSLEQSPATSYTGQAGLVVPQRSFFYAENPGTLREPEEGPPTYEVSVTAELQQAREALYDATRLLMRSAPDDALTYELYEAACRAWLAHVAAEPDMRDYTTGHKALMDTRTIWLEKHTQGVVNLGNRAQLPPFFGGNTQLVELFIQSPHSQCDFHVLKHLPNLKCLTLYAQADAPAIETIHGLLPHLTNRSQQEAPSGKFFVYLSVDGYPLPSI